MNKKILSTIGLTMALTSASALADIAIAIARQDNSLYSCYDRNIEKAKKCAVAQCSHLSGAQVCTIAHTASSKLLVAYIAVAASPTKHYFSSGFDNRQDAMRAALANCGKESQQCRPVTVMFDGTYEGGGPLHD